MKLQFLAFLNNRRVVRILTSDNQLGTIALHTNSSRIVMVDDDQDDLFLTKRSFSKAPFPVDFVGLRTGQELYDYIKFHGIGSMDILLLDINMPIVSGYDILAELRRYPHFGEIKVVMFSTSRRIDERKKALKMGAKDFVVKPSSQQEIDAFLGRIKEHLEVDDLAIAS